MTNIISVPFGWLMAFCYNLLKNYGLAILLFTIITRTILIPLSVKQQKNTARMALLNPKIEKIKKKYGNNRQKIQEETMALQSEEHINPMAGCLPLLIQMPILWGLFNVINKPLKFIMGFSGNTIDKAVNIVTSNDAFKAIASSSNFKQREEIYVIQAFKENPGAFSDMGSSFADKVSKFDLNFLGGKMDLGLTPTMTLNILILIPIFSFLANFIFTLYSQKKNKQMNPSMQQMGSINAVMYIMPIISAAFTFSVPAGVGLYWIFSSLFSLFQSMLLYRIYTPERMAVYHEKEKAKAKNKKPGFYQKMLEAQQTQQNGGVPVSRSIGSDTSDEKLSKSAIKDLQRQRLNEARKRMAEKYGDVYDENVDE